MPTVRLTETDKDRARLAENLRLIEAGRNVREMATIIGVSPAAYSRRRKQPETLSYKEIYRLCKEAGVDIRAFCGGKLELTG